MNYFTERNGMRKTIEQTYDIDPSKYYVLLGCCEKYYDNIAWLYPKECDDELGCCGLDKYRLAAEMRYEIPDLYISSYGLIEAPGVANNTYGAGQNVEKYNQYALLDFIEFMYNNVHDINNSGFHKFYNHYHLLTMPSRKVMIEFLTDINSYFSKTGLLYHLNANGEVVRVIPNDVATPDIVNTVLSIKEEDTRSLLQEALILHRSHAQNAARDSVEKLWDAFERMKTYYKDLDKKHSSEKIVADMAEGSDDFYRLFDEEFKWLTNAGNKYRIRHHETDKINITDVRYYDFFFNRCLSLLALAVQYLR